MVVLEREPPLSAAARHVCHEIDLNGAASILHLLNGRERRRHQPERQAIAVDLERQIAKDTLRVRLLFRGGEDAIPVRVDDRTHGGKHVDTRRQPHLRYDAILLHRDRRGLQVLIDAMRERGRRDEREDRRAGCECRSHFDDSLRP